jgi:sugar lactone lactonase YvrE
MKEPELIVDAHAIVGEGPWWDRSSKSLYWIDIKGRRFHVFDPERGADRAVELGKMPGTLVGRRSGGLLLAMEDGFSFVDPVTGITTFLFDPEFDLPDNRFNDGKCDSHGRFWAGTMYNPETGECTGSLYRLGVDLSYERILDGIGISNGLAWSPDDRTMYYIDTYKHRVDAFDFEPETGSIDRCRVAFEVPSSLGSPDGMTIDEEGMLWVALWGGWGIGRWDPHTGRLLEKICVPVARTSSCAFGGPDLNLLYITTASIDMKPEETASQPHAGGLFVCEPGIKGAASEPFAG